MGDRESQVCSRVGNAETVDVTCWSTVFFKKFFTHADRAVPLRVSLLWFEEILTAESNE